MRFKLDENLPAELTEVLGRHGVDVDTVPMEGLAGQPDAAIWSACLGEGRFLITQDLDFSDIRRYRPGTHPGLLLVRLDAPSRRNLIARMAQLFECEDVDSWTGCFVVVTDTKIRIRRP